ncbi:zinc ABC transporter substrate-binding protein [Aneurinibacillus sp. Ricciae_BoGa-3]|uniref:metal ABC transporter solute-binding protein, Zn/Mn family n=1 Tax=Aneurinibacillus sp. Ricciae_BoGa-3 TaxID=3022697 RepID=UPI002340FD84|nr:zinc ABC transporter substrate-binding protein [Aneurinibacillus sp. Ricciae_BoGa-3]WCK52775.1 zinc ABC transporter substrate-binding protein [Aneurinibacillus sp. Ricciae_BoGa-3]
MKKGVWTTTFALTLASVFVLAGCSSSQNAPSTSASSAKDEKIKIVAAENFYGEVAQAVGGDRVEVTSILTNPDTDPHGYESTPDNSKSVYSANVVVYNGAGYDSWMEKMINAGSSNEQKSVIKVAEDLQGKKEGDNEHVWYDPTTMTKLANSLADQLSKIDAKQTDAYHQRAKQYIASLAPLTEKVQKLKQSSPTPIAVSEPIFDYMVQPLNLTIDDTKFAKAIDEGTDPSPVDVGTLQNDLKGKKVKLFVHNVQNSSPTVENMVKLARSSGVPIVQVTETEPKGKNYLQWMTDQLDQVGKALGSK